jgi:hypothetical protein
VRPFLLCLITTAIPNVTRIRRQGKRSGGRVGCRYCALPLSSSMLPRGGGWRARGSKGEWAENPRCHSPPLQLAAFLLSLLGVLRLAPELGDQGLQWRRATNHHGAPPYRPRRGDIATRRHAKRPAKSTVPLVKVARAEHPYRLYPGQSLHPARGPAGSARSSNRSSQTRLRRIPGQRRQPTCRRTQHQGRPRRHSHGCHHVRLTPES